MAEVVVIEATTAYERLSPRHRRFVDEYVAAGANGAAAVRAAGYKSPHPQIRAYRLLQRPRIRAAIAERSAQAMADCERMGMKAIATLNAIATSDITRVFDEHGEPKPIEEIDEATRLALAEYTVETFKVRGGTVRRVRVRMQDKLKAMDSLGRMQKLW